MARQRVLILGVAIAAAAWCADPAQIDFVQMSDVHVANIESAHPGIAKTLDSKREAAGRFAKALENVRREVVPAFILLTGDLSDAYAYEGPDGRMVPQMDAFKRVFDASPIPIYPTLGNHDITQYRHAAEKPAADQSIAADARQRWRGVIPNFSGGTYYTVSKTVGTTEFLFLMLDDGDGNGKNDEFVAKQLAWIQSQIAAHTLDSIVLVMHIPLMQAAMWPRVKTVLANAPNVALSIAGHRHNDGMEEVDLGTRRLVQVRTAAIFTGEDHWRKFRLREDRIQIFAPGSNHQVEKTVDARPVGALARKLTVNPIAHAQVPLGSASTAALH